MKTIACAFAFVVAFNSLSPAMAAAEKGPRLGFDPAALEDRMAVLDMTTTASTGASRPFSVVFVDDLSPADPMRLTIEQKAGDPVRRAALRSFIDTQPAVLSQLRAQNLDEANIVGLGKDGDGNAVVYLR